jgi:hypothetical protein
MPDNAVGRNKHIKNKPAKIQTGATMGYVSYTEDITEKYLDSQLESAKKLLKSTCPSSGFSGNVTYNQIYANLLTEERIKLMELTQYMEKLMLKNTIAKRQVVKVLMENKRLQRELYNLYELVECVVKDKKKMARNLKRQAIKYRPCF